LIRVNCQKRRCALTLCILYSIKEAAAVVLEQAPGLLPAGSGAKKTPSTGQATPPRARGDVTRGGASDRETRIMYS